MATPLSSTPTAVPVNQPPVAFTLAPVPSGSPAPAPGLSPPLPPPPPPPAPQPANVGRFGRLNTVDTDVAELLHELEILPGVWGQDAAKFAFFEVLSKNLIGIVRGSNVSKVTAGLSPDDLKLVNRAATASQNANALYQGLSAGRGVIFMQDVLMIFAATVASTRDFAKLVFIHELTHHRTRANISRLLIQGRDLENQVRPAPSLLSPLLDPIYADPPLALKFPKPVKGPVPAGAARPPGTFQVRATFVNECAARHVAWNLSHELTFGPPPPPLLPGQLYRQSIERLEDTGSYGDNGYVTELRKKSVAQSDKQAGLWLADVAKQTFHGDPKLNATVQAFHASEAALAASTGFKRPTVKPDGQA
jgi:hypothetical protein